MGKPLLKLGVEEGSKVDDFRSIVRQDIADYGRVCVKLGEVMDSRGITRNRLRSLTGVKYDVIDRYYKGTRVAWADLDFLAKVCYVLNCEISEILEYIPPRE